MPVPPGEAEKLFGYTPVMGLDEFREFCKPRPRKIKWPKPAQRECLDCGGPMFPMESEDINPVWRCVRCGCPEENREATKKEVDKTQ